MERGGWVAEVAGAHDGLLLKVELEEVIYPNAIGVPSPERKVFILAEVFDRFAYGDLNWVFAKIRENTLAPSGLEKHEGLGQLLVAKAAQDDVIISAICAAPLVLGGLGLLEGKQATCYPGFEDTMKGATYTAAQVTVDGNVFTACGPAAAWELGFTFVAHFCGEAKADELRRGMQF